MKAEAAPNIDDALRQLAFIRNKKQEYVVCLSFIHGRLIRRRVVTIGLLDVSLAHPREVFAGPLKDRASTIIIGHNHPSGDVAPSRRDIATTQQLAAAGQLLGIGLEDHIIITKSKHFSFKAAQLL